MADSSALTLRPTSAAVDLARRRPGTVLCIVLGFHLLVWTLLPLLVCPNLQLDLVEDLALGKEWQLGYWKHPPLPWWIADLVYRITGDIHSVYLLGPLSIVVTMYAVWRLGRELVEPLTALVAVLALEGIHYFNFSAVKFAHDHTLLVFWALTGLIFYHALRRGRAGDWVLSGISLALCFWSKYTAFTFAATLGLFLLLDPVARRVWRTPGPYLMALAFAVVIAPNAWWLVQYDFLPFAYVEARAHAAASWIDYLKFPLKWTASQIGTLLPAIGLLGIILYRGGIRRDSVAMRSTDTPGAFARRYLTAIALGPFVVTTLAALLLGREPVSMWGFALWGFAPLAALMWFTPVDDPRRLTFLAWAFAIVLIAYPVIYAAAELGEPLLRDRPKATQFPGRLLAETVTRQWRERTGMPLRYVGGAEVGTGPGEFAVNNVAVYSADRPQVLVHGNLRLSPWISRSDIERHGILFVWQADAPGLPRNIERAFPTAKLQSPLVLPRQTLVPRSPVTVYSAIVLPRRNAAGER